ncbi:amino acid transporter [Myriangium duriaei CBS 260.36]|uniref:Amino acid transporter n=1 Tax=Myriangium duriaei CBS 260.36 TaxID=1168546 RepID=A0A9P4J0U1_9PEZI|nr:amino acid transporter [Myriangium duriaei CBS 260.36]
MAVEASEGGKDDSFVSGVAKDPLSSDVDSSAPIEEEQAFQFSDSRKLGVTGATFLIINKMIGTGVFSTPSGIFQSTGSVGISIMLWVVGGILTFCGLSVFLEFGLAIPRSGGEKVYLERVYKKPKLLTTCMFMAQMVLLGFSAGNALSFGKYVLFASGHESPGNWASRGIGIVCIVFCCTLHAVLPKWGIRANNILGAFKVIILVFIVFAGFAALAGRIKVPKPHNFRNAFAIEITKDYGGGGVYVYSTALLNIVYSYKGWEATNYVLGEVKNPRKTLKIAAPLAVGGVTILYVLANVAYFAAIDKTEMATSEALVAAIFFRNVFGGNAGSKALPAFVVLSNLGNVMTVSFSHSRVLQEFAKESIMPFSRFFASNKPFNAPATSLFLHGIVSIIVLIAPPPGPAYSFLVNLYTYPGAIIDGLVAAGLIYLHLSKTEQWSSPFRTWLPVIVIYLLSNIFLAITPFIPPTGDLSAAGYPYYVFPVVGIAVLGLGIAWWYWFMKLWPRIAGHKIVAERFVSEDEGREVVRYRKVSTKRITL